MIRSGLLRPLFLVLVALAAVGCGGAQSRYASHMERGKSYFAEGNFDKAGIEFRNALQIQPKAAEALHFSGRVAERKGDLRGAVGLYQAAVDADAEYVPAREDLGRIFVLAGETDRALKLIEPTLAKHPDSAGLLTVRGAARFQMKNREGAREDAEHAVKLAPTNESAVALLAGIYQDAHDVAAAKSLILASVEKLPKSVDLRQILAVIYTNEGELDKAQEQLRKIIELKPKELPRRLQLASFFVHAQKPDDAQKVLEQAVAALPESDDAKMALVDFIATRRSRADGEKTLQGFIAREPDNYDLRIGLGTLLQRSGDVKGATAAFSEVIKRDGTGAKGLIARDRVAALQMAQGNVEGATKLINEVLSKNPRDIDALTLRGNIALQQGDPSAAITDLRAVLRDQPNSVQVQRTLARAHLAVGEPALAEQALHAAMDSAPQDTAVRVDLGLLLTQNGRAEQAATLLEETVKQDPNNVQAREALVRTYLAKNDFAMARVAAEDLKRVQPKGANGPYLAGLAAQGQRKLDESEKEFEQALQLQPGAIDVLSALARLHMQQGKGAAALARVQKAVDEQPKNAYALSLLGELYLASGDAAKATEVLQRATQIEPRMWQAYRDLALAHTASKDLPGAIGVYEAAVKIAPGVPELVAGLASLYEQQGRIDDAIAQYEGLYARYKGNARERLIAANNLAMLLVTYKKDRTHLDRARELTAAFATSEVGNFLDTSGWVSYKRGEYQDALGTLQRAIEREPKSKVIRYHLAMAQMQTGRREEARNNLESALEGTPRFSGVEEARAALASLGGKKSG